MNNNILHTPDGMRDLYGDELKSILRIKEIITNNNHSYGYNDICTPTLEFLDVYSKDKGTASSKELYQFFDREGNTLCLRPDYTPAIARCVTKYHMDEVMPLRFAYDGNAFQNISELQGKLKETRQLGIELINDDSVEADVEVISLVIENLLKLGLKDFQISLGNTDFFKGICKAADFDEETENTVREYILSKNYFSLLDYVKNQKLDSDVIKNIESISKLFMSEKDLENLKNKATHPLSVAAVDRLLLIKSYLDKKGYDKYISFDLSMLSNYRYYTGVMFKCYTYGVGDAIVKGGRYDSLLSKFGKNSPAIGCVFLADGIFAACKRQNIDIPNVNELEKYLLVYDEASYEVAINQASELRNQGMQVTCFKRKAQYDDAFYNDYSAKNGFDKILFIKD